MIHTLEDIQRLTVEGFIDWDQFGHVSTFYHEEDPYILFNYNRQAQYEGNWTNFERLCRGLILNHQTGEVVARSFDKFFNWGEEGISIGNPGRITSVTEKMDGCFLSTTRLNLWEGGTISIGEVVKKKLSVVLKGVDSEGKVVPCQVVDWFDNGTKDKWLLITVDCDVSEKAGTRTGNHIPITPNHIVRVNGKDLPALKICEGDTLTTTVKRPDYSVLHLMESGLLGDGNLSRTHNSFRYSETHALKHEEYTNAVIFWLGECGISTRLTESGYGTTMKWATSKTYKYLSTMRDKWYPNGIKRIPKDLNWIDDFSIAKWFMDDGSLVHSEKQKDRIHFATNSFTEDECYRLAQKLFEMYSVSTAVYFSKGWNIRVNYGPNGEIHNLWNAISPYLIPCMRYKLPQEYRTQPYLFFMTGKEVQETTNTTVLKIQQLGNEKSHNYFNGGRKGFDIKTTTSNYFAKGVLVHNSLGVLYRSKEGYKIASRGSFYGEQAVWGSEILQQHNIEVPNEITPIFEIIHPENRIVVDYKDRKELVLLALRNRFTGEYLSWKAVEKFAKRFDFSLPRRYTYTSVEKLLSLAQELPADQEGWVVEFENESKWKFKGDEYRRIHRIISRFSFKYILEAVTDGTIQEVLNSVPDDFLDPVYDVLDEITEVVERTKEEVEAYFASAPRDSRKDFALWVGSNCKHLSSYMYAKLDGRCLDPLVYKLAFRNKKGENT